MTNLNYKRYSDYYACLQVSILVIEKYSRFLWSIIILIEKTGSSR